MTEPTDESGRDRLKYESIPFYVHEGVFGCHVFTDVKKRVHRCKIMYVYKERSDFWTVL